MVMTSSRSPQITCWMVSVMGCGATLQISLPVDNKAFNAAAKLYLHKGPDYVIQPSGKENMIGENEYYVLQNKWDATYAKATITAIDNILKKYFPAGRPSAN